MLDVQVGPDAGSRDLSLWSLLSVVVSLMHMSLKAPGLW